MVVSMELKPGMKNSETITVESRMTASSMKSGALEVLATPILIAYMENCCMECAGPALETGLTTVGTAVRVNHLAPTPVGMRVRFDCELTKVDGRRLVFRVEAFDELSKVGEGEHERFVVDGEKFTRKCMERFKK